MNVRIKTIGDTAIPKYQTPGAVGFDFSARETTVIPARSIGLVPTGCVIEVPPGYMLHVGARSSTPKKKGLLVPHGFGVIDQDYCGDGDEILLQFYNFTDKDVTVEKGERVGQGVFVRVGIVQFEQVQSMGNKDRGGFGSTKH